MLSSLYSGHDSQSVIKQLEEALTVDRPLGQVMEFFEKSMILAAYHRHKKQLTATYRALKIPKTTFYSKWKKYCT